MALPSLIAERVERCVQQLRTSMGQKAADELVRAALDRVTPRRQSQPPADWSARVQSVQQLLRFGDALAASGGLAEVVGRSIRSYALASGAKLGEPDA